MTNITQTLTSMPDPANPATDDVTTFSVKAAVSSLAQKNMVTELQGLIPQINTVSGEVAANAGAAGSAAGTATAQANAATNQAIAAAAAAATAINAPGTSATSVTSLTVGTGAKALTLAQTGKAFIPGQWVSISDSATPADNWMLGAITAFNSTTGAMTVNVSAAEGTITGASWVVVPATPQSTNSTYASITVTGSAIPTNGMYLPAANTIGWSTNSTLRMSIDASGRVGIGAAPSAWGAGYFSIDVGPASAIYGSSAGTAMTANSYFNGAAWVAKTTGFGTILTHGGGAFTWYSAPSVAAGAAQTHAVTLSLDASGNLTASGNVGQTSDERLKNDWSDLPIDFVGRLARVKHGTYSRTDTGVRQVGVSAQSLQMLMPEAVLDGGDGLLSVAYGNAALAACVMLAREVGTLKQRLATLEGAV